MSKQIWGWDIVVSADVLLLFYWSYLDSFTFNADSAVFKHFIKNTAQGQKMMLHLRKEVTDEFFNGFVEQIQ